jgi:SAM-dependent methyltransferase
MNERAVDVAACPACDGTDAPQVGSMARGFDSTIAGRRFSQPDYAVRCCASCGLYFKSATLSGSELAAFYAAHDGSVFDVEADFPTDRILAAELQSLRDGNQVLDFGCSTGRILKDHARRLVCTGIEPNAAAAATARTRGIDVIPAERLPSAGPFDAILLTDVFEHLARPMALLRTLAARLESGGRLIIVTGNADAIASRSRLAEHWYFRLPDHLIMLSERHLGWLASQLGMRVVKMHRCSHYTMPFHQRLKQRVQEFAYQQFQDSPRGPLARVLRWVPRLSAAQHWTTAPALGYRADHMVAILERPASHPGMAS